MKINWPYIEVLYKLKIKIWFQKFNMVYKKQAVSLFLFFRKSIEKRQTPGKQRFTATLVTLSQNARSKSMKKATSLDKETYSI